VQYSLYKKYDEFFKDCNYCWALRLCKKCFNNVNKKERLCKKRKEKLCEQIKKNIERNLITYCEIIEKNPNAFEVFKGVKMT
jgi:sulfatase maturation enzyme AslB (radical SAM superfamily)